MTSQAFIQTLFSLYGQRLFHTACDWLPTPEQAREAVFQTMDTALSQAYVLMNAPNPVGWLFVTLREIAAPLPEISNFDLSEEKQNIRRQLEHTSAVDFDESLWNLYLEAIAHLPAQQHFCDPQKDFQDFQRMHAESFSPVAADITPKAIPQIAPKKKRKPISQRAKFLSVMLIATTALSFYSLVSGSDFLEQLFSKEETPSSAAEPEQVVPVTEIPKTVDASLRQVARASVAAAYDQMEVQYLNIEADTVQEVMAAYGVTTPMMPTWVPKGFKKNQIQVTVNPIRETTDFVIDWIEKPGVSELAASVYPLLPDENGSNIEKDSREPIVYEAGGVNYYIFHNLDQVDAVAYIDDCEVMFWGNVSVEEMKKIVDSVYEGEN